MNLLGKYALSSDELPLAGGPSMNDIGRNAAAAADFYDPHSIKTVGPVKTVEKESNWWDNLFGTDDNKMFGLGKDQWAGLGTLSDIGGGIYGLYNSHKQAGLAEDYYNHQMKLEDEKAQRARDEYTRLNKQRADTNAHFAGKPTTGEKL